LISLAATASLLLSAPASSSAAPPACAAGSQPSRDINSYMLFAYSDLYIKGATAAIPGRGLFTGGDLGTNGFASSTDPNMTLGTNYGVFLSDGNSAVADRIQLGPGHPLLQTSVWDLFSNQIANADFVASSIRNTGPTCFVPPIIDAAAPNAVAFTNPGGPYNPTLPVFPSAATLGSAPDVQVPNNGTLNLAPGDYGDVDINDDGVLNLASGVYNLRSINSGKGVTINTQPNTDVRIAVDFRNNNDITVQGSDFARFYIRGEGLGPTDLALSLGYNTKPNCPTSIAVHGQFFIPTGRVNLGDCTNIFGRVWADVIRNDTNINVSFRAEGALDGTKYFDQNADGLIAASEPTLAGFTFYVDYNDNSQLDPGEPSAVTDANGHYTIAPVNAGNWKIRELAQPDYACTFPTPCSYDIQLGDGEHQGGFDFANRLDNINHFQCYEIHRPPMNRAGFSLEDAFGPSTVTIKRAKRLCLPANKNGEDPTAATDPEHLTYYTLKQSTPFTKVSGVVVDNQFGISQMRLSKPDRMLIPTSKSLTGPPAPLADPIDSFKCYRVSGAKFRSKDVTVVDQFGTLVVDVKKPLHLCLPAVADGIPIIDPVKALMCYQVKGPAAPPRPPIVYTLNMFGPDAYPTFGPRDLCLPSDVTLP